LPPFPLQPGEYRPSGPRGNLRDTTNDIAINQTDFVGGFDTGGVRHDFVGGLSFMREDFDLYTGNVLRNANGSMSTADIRLNMQRTMQKDAAVFRTGETLAEGAVKIREVNASFSDVRVADRSLVFNTDLIEALVFQP
jgi:outer membrane receptor for monomeric catechols